VSPADDAFVVYTSGSTAAPKAVVHGQWSVATKPRALAPIFLMTGDDRTMPLLPVFWLGGIAAALQVLCTGSTLVYPPSPEIDDVLETVERHEVTYIVVWHALAKLRAAAKARGIDVDRIRGFGSPPRDEHGEPIPGRLRANLLGMSESFSAHSAEPIDRRMPEEKEGSSGRAVHGIERRVVDQDTGDEVPPGEVGELQIRGGGLMTGFYKVPRDEVFTADGFYPTKDLVRIDADGYLWFVGRTGDMIKTNSANVSRLEVEAAMNALPEVARSLVAALPHPELGEMVAAAVIPAPGADPTEDGLRAALRDHISSFKIPRRIVFITDHDVPLTTTGKIRLFDLAELIESRLTPTEGRELA
jgi:acyl-coenzyme A synthetase/AMP-(fatty) acid ligase